MVPNSIYLVFIRYVSPANKETIEGFILELIDTGFVFRMANKMSQ